MGKGKVSFSPQLITELLRFPLGWQIEDISMTPDGIIEMIISGDDFPEETGINGAEIKRCLIVVTMPAGTTTEKILRHEVKVLD